MPPDLRQLRRSSCASGRVPNPPLLVLLHGAYMQPEDFLAAGFDSVVSENYPLWELCLPEFDVAQISDGSALELLRQRIVLPAFSAGRSVWLTGISLGGFLALVYAMHWPDEIDGLCLLSPYPGSRLTINAINAAGGLADWQPSPEQTSDPEFQLWHSLRTQAGKLPTYFAYGASDRFASGMQQMASLFPEGAVRVGAGGHDWPTWRTLWDDFLATGLLPAHGEAA